jgi:hypothetical protein
MSYSVKMHVLSLLFLIIPAFSAFPENGIADRSLDAVVAPEKGTVGDTFTYTLTITGSELNRLNIILPEVKTYFPEPEKITTENREKKVKTVEKDDVVPLYSIKSSSRSDGSGNGKEVISVSVQMSYFRPGSYTLPEIKVIDSDGIMIGYRLPSVKIDATNRDGNPEEVESPLDITGSYERLYAVMAIAALLGLAGFFAFRYYKKDKQAVVVAPAKLSPFEYFMKETEESGLGDRAAGGDVRGYVFGISIIFRRFLARQFGFDATEMTTDEIRLRLKKYMQPALYERHASEVLRAMDFWDLSKFAEFSPSKDLLQDNLAFTVKLVSRMAERRQDGAS